MTDATGCASPAIVTAAVRRVLIVLATLTLSSCVSEPVEWSDVAYRHSKLGDPPAISAVRSANLPVVPGTVAPCVRSIVARNHGAELFRAWWAVRGDSNAVLAMQRSTDGGRSWQQPVQVDDRDAGRRGCDRPAPAIAYDSSSRYVYLAYFLDARDGSGVFFAHSMDEGRIFGQRRC